MIAGLHRFLVSSLSSPCAMRGASCYWEAQHTTNRDNLNCGLMSTGILGKVILTDVHDVMGNLALIHFYSNNSPPPLIVTMTSLRHLSPRSKEMRIL